MRVRFINLKGILVPQYHNSYSWDYVTTPYVRFYFASDTPEGNDSSLNFHTQEDDDLTKMLISSFEMCWRRMERMKLSEKVTNGLVLERIGDNRILLNNILRRKPNWFGHTLRINCLIMPLMTEIKGVGRTTQVLDDLRNRRRY